MNRKFLSFAALAAVVALASVGFADVAHAGAIDAGCPDVAAGVAVADDGSLSSQLKAALNAGNLGVAIVLCLLGGLLTALSPCVYPLIPITLSILGARQAGSALKGFALASTYVGGMVVLYTTLGVSFAWAGALAGSALQSPWITIGVALFCVAMAASMFGAFEFVLPSSLQTRLSQAGGSGFQGAFIMGLVAGVIAAPCTGPVLSFILTLIARERDLLKGGTLMFFYALGMGLPFLVLGTFSQAIARMPKSGKWMETVKSIFGLLMLGAGLYYLQIGVPAVAEALAPLGRSGMVVGPVLVVVGVLVGALKLSFKNSSTVEKVRKGTGVALATTGLLAFLAWTNATPTEPTTTTTTTTTATTAAAEIAWVHVGAEDTAVATFTAAMEKAKVDCKPVMIDFGADWCIACKELDKFTYVDDAVRKEAQRFVNIKIDATSETPGLTELQTRYGVVGLPTVVMLGSAQVRGVPNAPTKEHLTGFLKAPEYLAHMRSVR
jgi:thiol:disulfide interchange protein DsbD